MENTLENKAKFFAQYYGQKVFWHHEYGDEISVLTSICLETGDYYRYLDDGYCLLLKSIEDITDEDAEELGRLIGWKYPKEYKNHFLDNHLYGDSIDQLELDFLREKGYAVPFRGLSVQKLVEYSWVKLKNKES